MASPNGSPSQPATVSPPAEAVAQREEREKEMVYRTKAVQFLGRTTPIILQNDNGPCPLLAICNVLSLKNNLNLSPDIPEVSQEKLLSLVAERLIDSNSNIDNKDSGYVENQQQNISDAIDLLPRLTTGIDVNIKFRRIGDFEFTPECAIFDLLDIPLYHGWIVDPQDHETAEAIGSKSYNTLMAELVSLDTHVEGEQKKNREDDDAVDFVAATTAALGVPSPCLSRGQSFDDSPKARKGDIEEEAELLRVLKLSEVESSNTSDKAEADVNFHQSVHANKSELAAHSESVERNVISETVQTGTIMSTDSNAASNHQLDTRTTDVGSQEVTSSPSKDSRENTSIPPCHEEPRKFVDPAVVTDVETDKEKVQPVYLGYEHPSAFDNSQDKLRKDDHQKNGYTTASDSDEPRNHQNVCKTREATTTLNAAVYSNPSSSQLHRSDGPETFYSSIEGSEPIYEGEECILDSRTEVYENREPIYEGEVVLAEQVDKSLMDVGGLNSQDKLSTKKGEIIRNFMKTSASQLTIYGLFCLQDKVKERELCVFFRNNHFNTMFKHEGQLYILATDQGYSNQPDLVWEKLNEVNGDTVYMTSNFKEFKMDDHSTSTWDEQNAMASTADYLASIDGTQSDSNFNSDLQLAMALQQQEFEQQQQRQQQQQQQQQQNTQQPAITGGASKLVTGPQVARSSGKYTSSSSRPDSKSKEKCIVM